MALASERNIVIVSDNPVAAKYHQNGLERAGFKVALVARNQMDEGHNPDKVMAAVNAAVGKQPDMVVSHLPVMDEGPDKAIIEQTLVQETPVVILSELVYTDLKEDQHLTVLSADKSVPSNLVRVAKEILGVDTPQRSAVHGDGGRGF